MQRWGHLETSLEPEMIARSVYRPEVFRAAAERLGLPCPEADSKAEGEHRAEWMLVCSQGPLAMGADMFMDERRFDPQQLQTYVDGFAIRRTSPDQAGETENAIETAV